MHRTLTITLLLLALSVVEGSRPACAAGPKGLGLGIVVGGTTGLAAKYFVSDLHAIDAAFGGGDAYAGYLWHGWNAFEKQPSQGRLATFLGLGGRIDERGGRDRYGKERDTELGIRGALGIAFYLPDLPIEFTFELNPVINLTGGGSDLDAGLAARYYFKRFN